MVNQLRLCNISIKLDETPIMEDVSLEIISGEVVAFMGPSGSGKSTFLSWICGTIAKEFSCAGTAFLNGREISALPSWKRNVGILFQDDLLFDHLSVGGNLAFGLPAHLTRRERHEKIEEALFNADLEGYAKNDPATLSSGQRVRIALMRCLLAKPQLLLLDEPFSRLDITLRKKFRKFVFSHTAKAGLPVILVTHDIADTEEVKGRIFNIPLIGDENKVKRKA